MEKESRKRQATGARSPVSPRAPGALFLVLCSVGPALAAPVPDSPPIERAFLVDQTGDLALHRVLDGRFESAPRRASFGYSDAVHYLRLHFEHGLPPGSLLEVSYPQLDQIQVFAPTGAGWSVTRAGDSYPFWFRSLPHRTFLFILPKLAPNQSVLVRFQSTGSLNLATRVLSRSDLYQTISGESYLFGLYYGIAIVMALLYLFVFFTIKERSSLFYALHVVFQALFHLSISGVAFHVLWPNSPGWANISAPLFGACSLYFALRFTREFLELRLHLPSADRFFRLLGMGPPLILLALVCGFFSVGTRMLSGLVVVFTPAVLLVASILWIQGYRPARLFLAGWSAFLLGILFYALFLLGLTEGNLLLEHSMQVGSALQMLILALAITARIGVLRTEKEEAHNQVLTSERRRRRLQERMAHRLQRQVEKRTAQLSLLNATLLGRDEEMTRELELAARIQRGLLPPDYLELAGLRLATYCRYVTGVGGDYLDIFRLRNGPLGIGGNRVGILSADVAGHGIPAALVTSMAKICFQDAVRAHRSPKRVLIEVNRSLLETVASGLYLTAFYMTIDEGYAVRYCGGGHPDPLVFRNGTRTVETWSAAGFLIGAMPGMEGQFEESRDSLASGDRILLYTDGLTEARARDGAAFGPERLSALFLKACGLRLAEALRFVLDEFERQTEPEGRADDYSLVMVEADPSCVEDQSAVRLTEHIDRRAKEQSILGEEELPE